MTPLWLIYLAVLLALATFSSAGGRSEAAGAEPAAAAAESPDVAASSVAVSTPAPAAGPAATTPEAAALGSDTPASPPLDPLRAQMTALGFELPRRSVEAIEFELSDAQGTLHLLSAYRGNVVFLNFWATWCVPCRTEMPAMQALHTLMGEDAAFRMIAVNLQETPPLVNAFVDELQLSFDVLIDDTGKTAATYGARTLPISYVIGKDGVILARIIGIREWAEPIYFDLFSELAAE